MSFYSKKLKDMITIVPAEYNKEKKENQKEIFLVKKEH
jgi:hypothetical protein